MALKDLFKTASESKYYRYLIFLLISVFIFKAFELPLHRMLAIIIFIMGMVYGYHMMKHGR